MNSNDLNYSFLILFLLSGTVCQAQNKVPENVLFVGNSYTYFWNLPQQVSALAESEGISIYATSQSTSGGTNWGQHWRVKESWNPKA